MDQYFAHIKPEASLIVNFNEDINEIYLHFTRVIDPDVAASIEALRTQQFLRFLNKRTNDKVTVTLKDGYNIREVAEAVCKMFEGEHGFSVRREVYIKGQGFIPVDVLFPES